MKIFKISTLLILLMAFYNFSCGSKGGGASVAPELVDVIKGSWKIKSGTNLPADFANFRFTLTRISGDSANYTIVPQNNVARFDYNNPGTTGTVKLSTKDGKAASATVIFYHSPNQGVARTPNGTATPITIRNITSTGFTIEWVTPKQDAANPGGNKQTPSYSYTMEKAQ